MSIMSTTSDDPSAANLRRVWPPPRSPLPPYRLAKLANALGVSTPAPATYTLAHSSTSPASSSPSFPDNMYRSQTPSAMSVQTFSASVTSKYMLHVIPPSHLPHAVDTEEFTPLPASASGYHSQYKRGTLVPLHSTLQSQLVAIAKEYALPSTIGVVLYLVSSTPGRESVNPTPNSDVSKVEWDDEGPGPRLSDTIWKHIWTRVLKVERDDTLSFLSRTDTPDPSFPASLSSPSLLLESSNSPLRPLISPQKLESANASSLVYPITPSPSTPSSSYNLHLRNISKRSLSTPVDPEMSPSESSASLDPSAEGIDLPGLHSSSFIPVLAKVEFDIDRRKAQWYEPWLRSRRRNHAKRAESRTRTTSHSNGALEEDEERRAPIDLRLVGRLQAEGTPEFLRQSDDGYSLLDDDEGDDEAITSQFPDVPGGGIDPLADVFGTDADIWAEMHSGNLPNPYDRSLKNPNIVDLAFDAAALSRQTTDDDDQRNLHDDANDVRELWDDNSRPQLSVDIPTSPDQLMKSPGTASSKRHVPPALNLMAASPSTGLLATEGSPLPSSGEESAHLSYLKSAPSSDDNLRQNNSIITLEATDENGETVKKGSIGLGLDDKRGGAFFEDLDLGLQDNPDYEYDEHDPYDRRKSQYILSSKLDEIEKALVQFSPRPLRSEFSDSEEQAAKPRARSSVSSSSTLLGPNVPSPRSMKQNGIRNTSQGSIKPEDAVWPAVPYSTLNSDPRSASETTYYDDPSSSPAPMWTLNGVPAKSPYAGKKSSSKVISDETKARKEAEDNLYPPLNSPRSMNSSVNVIPLSPDPFGRFPSEYDSVPTSEAEPIPPVPSFPARKSSLVGMNQPGSSGPSSRFSMDSNMSEETAVSSQKSVQTRSSSLVSVKSIRKLWRKSNKNSVSAPPLPNISTGKLSPQPQNLPSIPGTPRSPSFNEMLPPPTSSLPPSRATSRADSSTEYLRFDQESRYPIHLGSGSSTPQPVAPLSLGNRSPSPSAPPQDKNASVRKSILKSWKSNSGSISGIPDSARPSVSAERPSTDSLSNPARKRRPSVFEAATALMRGSVVDHPPTPTLPDQYSNGAGPNGTVTKNNRSSMKSRPNPAAGSYSSTDSSSASVVSPVTNSSPPRNGNAMVRRASHESLSSRSSWENPTYDKQDQHGMRSSISYPYNELDHQE